MSLILRRHDWLALLVVALIVFLLPSSVAAATQSHVGILPVTGHVGPVVASYPVRGPIIGGVAVPALLLLGFILLVAELMVVPGSGFLATAGLISLVLGSVLLIDGAESGLPIAPWAILVLVIVAVAYFITVSRGVRAVARRRPTTGREGMLGVEGVAITDLCPAGQVFVHGEIWEAAATTNRILHGGRVKVVSLHGLRLDVEPVQDHVPGETARLGHGR